MRPTYENELDRVREAKVAKVVCDHLMTGSEEFMQAVRCPKYYPCDWGILKDGVTRDLTHLLEVKVRGKSYPEYMISLQKVKEIVSCAAVGGLVPLLAVYWEDEREMGIVDLLQCNRRAGVGGRTDRGDAQDIEPMVFIPRTEFKTFKPGVII